MQNEQNVDQPQSDPDNNPDKYQYTQRMMVQTAQEILTALCKDIYRGLARFGCGLEGIYYEEEP